MGVKVLVKRPNVDSAGMMEFTLAFPVMYDGQIAYS